jgi:SAM-dependent methyltransferase
MTSVDEKGSGTTPPPCEACGLVTAAWRIGSACILWRCSSCGHIVRDLKLCDARARAHPWGGSSGLDRVRSKLTMRNLRRALPRSGPLDILEIGFGRGLLLSQFLDQGHRVHGIDPGMLERDLAEPLRSLETLRAEQAESVQLPVSALDLIYGIHVVEHLSDPAVVFRNCQRALRDGGVLYLITPNARSRGLTLFRDAWWNLEDPTHVRFFSSRSISLMLRRAGFGRIVTRIPIADSLTVEISSLLRMRKRDPGEHGVMSVKGTLPLYALLSPVALAARALWPELSPSIEVLAWK